MAKVRFYLTNPKSKSETTVFSMINYGLFEIVNGKKKYLPLKYYTPVSILPKLWNDKLSRAKESIEFADSETYGISKQAVDESAKKNYNRINDKLSDIERTAKSLIEKLTVGNILPSHEILRAELDKIFKPHKQVEENGNKTPCELFSFIDHLIDTSTNRESTLKSYKVVKRDLLDYQKEKKTKLTFERIDIDFYNSFVEYLRKQNYATNTIGTRIKILKTFISEADDRGITVSEDYKKKSFKKPHEETHSVYLNQSELMQIYRMEEQPDFMKRLEKKCSRETLPDYLDRIRDIFLIGCYTGLRFSDLSQLKKENFNSDNTISVKTQKTNQNVVIPIHPIVKTILDKYDYQLPRIPSNQKFNDYIKDVAELAGINEKITSEITKGGFKVMETTEKFNLVTSHTARRSFATNAFLADVPSIAIMMITGHKTESAFMKYIKMSAKDNAIKMQMHPFFKMTVVK